MLKTSRKLYNIFIHISKMVLITVLSIISFILSSAHMIKSDSDNVFEVNFTDDDEQTLFDFTQNATTEGWMEKSDVAREVGMSKADLTIQKTQIFKRAIFFTLLNPQPNGACFAGVRIFTSLNLSNYTNLLLKVRGQGENFNYKIVLRHKNKNEEPNPTYEQFFEVTPNKFQVINLPFSNFKPYYRGKEVKNAEPLDKTQITSIGIQIYGGVYLPVKQSGVSSLEIDWIKVNK